MLATGRDVNVPVLDTEVYSNTGGQASKATPLGAVAKFAASGKRTPRKDLGLQMIAYGNVYVAQVAMGANPQHTLQAFREAEANPGPSLILAYSHCIAHGINMRQGMKQQDLATASGYGPLFRFNPEMRTVGENHVPTDLLESGRDIEARYTDIVGAVCSSVTLPVSIKLTPYLSSIGHSATTLVDRGAAGLVLFNRLLQPISIWRGYG